MTRSIRLVVIVSSPVPSDDDETNMNVEKHECSLLEALSDVGSTPTASTIFFLSSIHFFWQRGTAFLQGVLGKMGVF